MLNKLVHDHFFHPRCAGEFAADQKNVVTAKVQTPDQLTVMQLQIRIQDEIIQQTYFKTLGCPWCIAVTSYTAEWLIHKSLVQAATLTSTQLIELFELPREKYFCALLGEDLLHLICERARAFGKDQLS